MSWPPWEPKVGDLVRIREEVSKHRLPMRVAKPLGRGYAKVNIATAWVFLVLGQLDHEQKLTAAYAEETQADLDPIAPDTHQSYFWALCGEGIVVLTRSVLAPA